GLEFRRVLFRSTGAPVDSTEVSPSRMRSSAILRTIVAILLSSTAGPCSPVWISSTETPMSARSPPVEGASKEPTISSSTVTEAEIQRVMTARIRKELLVGLLDYWAKFGGVEEAVAHQVRNSRQSSAIELVCVVVISDGI